MRERLLIEASVHILYQCDIFFTDLLYYVFTGTVKCFVIFIK